MFIHLGGEKIIRANELIAIFDLSMEKTSKISKQFISNAEKEKKIEEDEKLSCIAFSSSFSRFHSFVFS